MAAAAVDPNETSTEESKYCYGIVNLVFGESFNCAPAASNIDLQQKQPLDLPLKSDKVKEKILVCRSFWH